MTPLLWYVFWLGFWADLLTPEHRHSAQIVSFADWKRDHPPARPVPPKTNGKAA